MCYFGGNGALKVYSGRQVILATAHRQFQSAFFQIASLANLLHIKISYRVCMEIAVQA